MYRFKVGRIYKLNVPVFDESGKFHDAGTKVRIISITPKVRITSGVNKDSREYFYNAVVANNPGYFPRIRENFCTLNPEEIKESNNGQ